MRKRRYVSLAYDEDPFHGATTGVGRRPHPRQLPYNGKRLKRPPCRAGDDDDDDYDGHGPYDEEGDRQNTTTTTTTTIPDYGSDGGGSGDACTDAACVDGDLTMMTPVDDDDMQHVFSAPIQPDADAGCYYPPDDDEEGPGGSSLRTPVPQCHNIVSTSQIKSTQHSLNLQRLSDLFPFTAYDRKRFAAITIRLANPHCTCLLFGSGKLVITGSTSFNACIVASQEITRILRSASPRDTFEVVSCQIQNLVAHVSLPADTHIDLDRLYERFNEQSTYQRSVFPGLVLRPPHSPIVLLIFSSGRIVCTGGRSYRDIYYGFRAIFKTLRPYLVVSSVRAYEDEDA